MQTSGPSMRQLPCFSRKPAPKVVRSHHCSSFFVTSAHHAPAHAKSLHHAIASSPSRMARPSPTHSLVTPTVAHHHTCSSPAAPRLIAAHCQQFWSTLKPCWNHVKRPGVLAIKRAIKDKERAGHFWEKRRESRLLSKRK